MRVNTVALFSFFKIIFLIIFLIFFILYLVLSPLSPLSSISVHGAEPDVAAQAAILMDAKTGRILWEKNSEKPMAMASTTKIMTSVIALESDRLEEIVTVSAKAAGAPKVKMFLSKGEKIRLYDLLLALMLESSNDAAVAIAEHLGGSVENFCAMMTEKARTVGAKDTVFETPNGLDGENHHSTAYDLAQITRYALEVPGFVQLTNTPAAKFKSDKRNYNMVNKNRLLREFPGANGVKTGFTSKAGHCFVGAAKREEMQLISVVLASGWGDGGRARKWVDTKTILNYGFNNFKYEIIMQEGAEAGKADVTRSRTLEMEYIYKTGLLAPLTEEEKGQIEVKVTVPPAILAPISKGDTMGKAQVYLKGELFSEVELTAARDAPRHDFKTSLEKVLNGWLGQIIDVPVQVVLPEF